MSRRRCLVSFLDHAGIKHTTEVEADSLYEAAALGMSRMTKDAWTDALAPATSLEVEVCEPSVRHAVTVTQLQRWAESTAVTPADRLRKNAVRELLNLPGR